MQKSGLSRQACLSNDFTGVAKLLVPGLHFKEKVSKIPSLYLLHLQQTNVFSFMLRNKDLR